MTVSTTGTVVTCPHCGRHNRVPAVAEGTPKCGNCHRPLPWIVAATDDDFARVAEADGPMVIVDLWAPWCEPCRMVSPALEHVATDLAGRVKLVKVDVDSSPELSRHFETQAIPTLVLMRNGTAIDRRVGAHPESALRMWIVEALGTAPS